MRSIFGSRCLFAALRPTNVFPAPGPVTNTIDLKFPSRDARIMSSIDSDVRLMSAHVRLVTCDVFDRVSFIERRAASMIVGVGQ